MTGTHGRILLLAATLALAASTLQAFAAPNPEIDPHRRRSVIYISVPEADAVLAVSREESSVLKSTPVHRGPRGLAARPDGDRIYVACEGGHAIDIIDGATRTRIDSVSLQHGSSPVDVVLGDDGGRLYVAASGLDQIYFIDTASLHQTGEVAVGRNPSRLALSPDGRRLYVVSTGSGRLDVVDTVRGELITSVPLGGRPADVAVDPSFGTVYVAQPDGPFIHALDEGGSRPRKISVDAPAASLSVAATGGRLLLASPASGRIAVVAPSTGAAIKVVDRPEITRVVSDPEGTFIYALSARNKELVYIDSTLGTTERVVSLENEPWDLELVP